MTHRRSWWCALVAAIVATLLNPSAVGAQTTPTVRVEVFARGFTGDEIVELRVNDATVKTFKVTTELREYNWTTTKAIGARAISVHFTNDARVAAGDRAVTIDRIVATASNSRARLQTSNNAARGATALVQRREIIAPKRFAAMGSSATTSVPQDVPRCPHRHGR